MKIKQPIRLGVLISGRGSNLQAIIDNIKKGTLTACVSVVISDVEGAAGLERGRVSGISTATVKAKDFASKELYEGKIVSTLSDYSVDLLILAGYMRIVGRTILEKYSGKVLNIHPSLLPAFPGLNAQRQAIDYGVKFSGCTVHFVDEGMDTGPIIAQAVVPVLDGDTEDNLSERILKEEHILYSKTIQSIKNKLP